MVIWILAAAPAGAYEVTDQFSINGVLSGAYQYQWVEDDADDDRGRGALPFQVELDFQLTEQDEVAAVFGFAGGNGLNGATAFVLAPWAADLEDDVKDINGRNRDYLLTVWYKHTFQLGDDNALAVTGGIIDTTAYLDENAYANDEFTQFLNEALVNATNAFLPSYDIGGAMEWEVGNLDLTLVGMDVGENDDGNGYHYFGTQLGYKLETGLGEGHYRLMVGGTSEDFLDETGDEERLLGAILSCDQALGDIFGVWIRLGWQEDKALIAYETHLSGGLNITGQWYGRGQDNIGIGYAYLSGDDELDYSQVAEVYWRVVLNDYIAVTADLQYMEDNYDDPLLEDIDGVIAGMRVTVEF
jgi:porin